MAFKMKGYSYPGKAPSNMRANGVVNKDELKRQGKTGEVTRRGDDASIAGEIKGRLEERAGKTETKTRKFLGREWKKTKKYDEKGRKVGKYTEVMDKGGKKIRHRQKGDISTDAPVKTEMKTTKKRRRDMDKTSGNKNNQTTTSTTTKTDHGPVKGRIGSDYRKAEYDKRGWKYDDTIAGYNRDGTKKGGGTQTEREKNQGVAAGGPTDADTKGTGANAGKTYKQTGGFGEGENSGKQVWEWVDDE